jgi:hypothetical protein
MKLIKILPLLILLSCSSETTSEEYPKYIYYVFFPKNGELEEKNQSESYQNLPHKFIIK